MNVELIRASFPQVPELQRPSVLSRPTVALQPWVARQPRNPRSEVGLRSVSDVSNDPECFEPRRTYKLEVSRWPRSIFIPRRGRLTRRLWIRADLRFSPSLWIDSDFRRCLTNVSFRKRGERSNVWLPRPDSTYLRERGHRWNFRTRSRSNSSFPGSSCHVSEKRCLHSIPRIDAARKSHEIQCR